MTANQVPLLASNIAADLSRGVNIVVLVPEGTDLSDVEARIESAIEDREPYADISRLVLSDWSSGSPVAFMSKAFSIQWGDGLVPLTVENLMKTEQLPQIIIAVEFAGIPTEWRRQWLKCVMECDTVTTRIRERYPVFCVVARANDPVLEDLRTSSNLKRRFWHNLHTQTHFIAQRQQDMVGDRLGEIGWKASLVTSLAGDDEYLADALSDVVVRSNQAIMSRLQDVADERQIGAEQLKERGVGQFVAGQNYQPLSRLRYDHPIVGLWAEGLLTYSTEYGWEVPCLLLAALGERSLVEHRIWRAQLPVILPAINQLRLLVIHHLAHLYDEEWLFQAIIESAPDFRDQGPPLASCWGAEPLELILVFENNFRLVRRASKFLPALRKAHSVRNRLAHYGAIEPVEYFDLMQMIQDVGLGR